MVPVKHRMVLIIRFSFYFNDAHGTPTSIVLDEKSSGEEGFDVRQDHSPVD